MVTPAEKRAHCERELWPNWRFAFHTHKVLVLPGIMGSQLFDFRGGGGTLWVDFGFNADIRRLAFAELTPEGGVDVRDQMVLANGTVWPPVGARPYAAFAKKIPSALFPFDWRESIPLAAASLRAFLYKAFDARPASEEGSYSIVTHSMGGCVLLYLLARTAEFDRWFKQIVCVAPPFHGAIRPIRVIEHGKGVPAGGLIGDKHLREVVATMPGLFQLAVAPRGRWVTEIPGKNGDIKLAYPIRDPNAELYEPSFWSDSGHPMRRQILRFARTYHETVQDHLPDVQRRLGDRFSVIVGLNGRNTLSRVSPAADGWRFHKNGAAPRGKYANGDGSVLLQSSYLRGFDTSRYWAYAPTVPKNIHSSMLDIDEVTQGVRAILAGSKPKQLEPYAKFIGKVDFSKEAQKDAPKPFEDLDYLERSRLRCIVPLAKWDEHGLRGPDKRDSDLLYSAAIAETRIASGASVRAEAERLGEPVEFLEGFIHDSFTLV